jgi:hypothetical protein
MCQIQVKSKRRPIHFPLPAVPTSSEEKLLREAAFVLQMTRRVKQAILAGKPLAQATRASELCPVEVAEF